MAQRSPDVYAALTVLGHHVHKRSLTTWQHAAQLAEDDRNTTSSSSA